MWFSLRRVGTFYGSQREAQRTKHDLMPYHTQRVGAPYLKRTGASFSLQEDAGVHLAVLGPRAHPFLSENTSPVFVRRFVWVCYALRVSTLLVSHGPSIRTKLAGHSASARYRLRTAPRSRVWSRSIP